MNRPVAPTAGGAFVLRPGRHYRMLVVVNMTNDHPTDVQLEEQLAADGFQDAAISLPQDWSNDLARDLEWPSEPVVSIAANEVLVRGKGAFFGHGSEHFDRDRPIDPTDAKYSVAACWECGPATRAPALEQTGAAAPAGDKPKSDTSKLVALGVIGTLLGGGWLLSRQSAKEAAQEEALARLEQKRERGELEERIAKYLANGVSREQAERQAEREIAAQAARRFAEELEADSREQL
jgi:hypothetical protein